MMVQTIWQMLNELYEPDDLMRFAVTPQPQILGGKTPFEALADEDEDGILALGHWCEGCMAQVAT